MGRYIFQNLTMKKKYLMFCLMLMCSTISARELPTKNDFFTMGKVQLRCLSYEDGDTLGSWGWKVKVTNIDDVDHEPTVTITFVDKDGFEVAFDYHHELIQAHQTKVFTSHLYLEQKDAAMKPLFKVKMECTDCQN